MDYVRKAVNLKIKNRPVKNTQDDIILLFNHTPYLFVATGTPGPIVEVTVQLLR